MKIFLVGYMLCGKSTIGRKLAKKLGYDFSDTDKMIENKYHLSVEKIFEQYHAAILCKGGHSLNDANDYLFSEAGGQWFQGQRIDNSNTHGTGCTLSSAIAAQLAKGASLTEAVGKAKEYISGALAAGLDLGKGSGPMNHGYMWLK